MKYLNIGVENLPQVADKIIKIGNEVRIWTFVGNLGAGKTTLIKILANKLHIKDSISSPTFSYVNEYDGKVFHFDCYRLRSLEEALDFGIEEYLDSGKPSWIEWPQIIEPILPTPYLEISIEHNENVSRNIYLKIIK